MGYDITPFKVFDYILSLWVLYEVKQYWFWRIQQNAQVNVVSF